MPFKFISINGSYGQVVLWGRKLKKILFYLYCFFCRAIWAVANGDYVEARSSQAVVVQYLFWKPIIWKILVRWFWKFWREQLLICCDTQSFFPDNFSHCSSPKIICGCFNNGQVIISSPCMFLLSVYTFKNFFTLLTCLYIFIVTFLPLTWKWSKFSRNVAFYY